MPNFDVRSIFLQLRKPYRMNRHKNTRPFIKTAVSIALLAGVGLSGCTTQRQLRGYLMDYSMVDKVTVGLDNVYSVEHTFGSPSITGTFDDSLWYYVSTGTITKAVFNEEPVYHLVLSVKFDEEGIVEDVRYFNLNDIQKIDPVNDKTPTRGRELSFWEQIFGNIGRFAAPTDQGGGGF